MFTVYLVCGAVGSAVLVVQLLMMLIGLDHGGHAGGSVEAGGDADGNVEVHGETHGAAHDDTSHFLQVLSFRALMAASAFFGLAGMASSSSGIPAIFSLLIALGAGLVAMYVVAWLMRVLYGLRSEGNVHIECALGSHGTVYLTIPGENAGAGKVMLNVQDRTMEYEARCVHGPLPTGAEIVVVDIVDSNTVQVEPAAGLKEDVS